MKQTTDSLRKCTLAFLGTRDVLMIPFVLVAGCMTYRAICVDWIFEAYGAFFGVLAFIGMEAIAHQRMHLNRGSPFYGSHWLHHELNSRESGVPEWWVFGFYGLMTTVIGYVGLPGITGAWFALLVMLTAYEFIHFLCHCNYRPKTAWGWRVRVNHKMHHNPQFEATRYEMMFGVRSTKGDQDG